MSYSRVEKSFSKYTPSGIHFLTFFSSALHSRGNVTLYIPPGHENDENLPFVVLLHGVYGSHWSYIYNGGAHVATQRLIDSGIIPPVALVVPSDGFFGEGSGYVKNARTDCEAWIVDDVINCVRNEYSCFGENADCYLAGFSMGGFGALRLGAKHPQLFKGISAHSSITHFKYMRRFLDLSAFDYGNLDEGDESVIYWMKKNRGALPPVRFDCGVDDLLIDGNRELHELLEQESIPHVYKEFPGRHSWDYWHEHLEDTLRFFVKR